jgi:serine-type D-Ala-D-Ala carboxypeptidase (penicillin-binding protein 5/6)
MRRGWDGRAAAASVPRWVAALLAALVLALPALLPGRAAALAPPRLGVTGAILVSPGTGQELYGVNPTRELAIASTTKLMTALLTLEHAKLSTTFTAPNYYSAAGDSQIGLVPGERMSVHDLLLALLLPSADDAAEDLAYNVGHHSVDRFISMMNKRARRLGLTHTHYSTPIGLDTAGNYSSAADLVTLAHYVQSTQPFFARAVAQRSAVLRTGNHLRVVANRNDLVGKYPWINGVKTGHTNEAGYVLVASARRNGMTLLSAVLGTDSEASRDANTLALLDYGYANFAVRTPVRAGMVLARPKVKEQPGKRGIVIATRSFTRVIPRADRVRIRLRMPHELTGPLRRHAIVGTALVVAGGHVIARVPVEVQQAIPAVSTLTRAARFITRPSTLALLAVLLLAAIVLGVVWRERTRGSRKREVAA